MRFLRIIRQDILWLNSRLHPALKIIGLIVVLALVVGGWYLGSEFWNVKGYVGKGGGRFAPRWERWGVIPGLAILLYMISVVERGRKSG